MENDKLKKAIESEELKRILEKKGFEETGIVTGLYLEGKKEERYFTLNASLGTVLAGKNKNVIIELSAMDNDSGYWVKFYTKK